jgi:NDP-sugar pyrophosphorylase family protein
MLPIVILAGGFGSRLGKITNHIPKGMVEINGFPFIYWQIRLLIKNGYEDFVYCLSYRSDSIRDYLGDGSKFGVKIRYSLDGETQLGTGGAVIKAIPLLGSEFAVVYGDSYLPIEFAQLQTAFQESTSPAMMAIFKNNNEFGKSNVELMEKGFISYDKSFSGKQKQYIDYGITYFRKSVFDGLSISHPIDLAEICTDLSNSKKLAGFEVFDRFYEIGSVQGIEEFSHYLLESEK